MRPSLRPSAALARAVNLDGPLSEQARGHDLGTQSGVTFVTDDALFYVTARKDDPNAFVFYEIYKSQAAQDFHLQHHLTKKFLGTLKSAQAADRVRTNLVEVRS